MTRSGRSLPSTGIYRFTRESVRPRGLEKPPPALYRGLGRDLELTDGLCQNYLSTDATPGDEPDVSRGRLRERIAENGKLDAIDDRVRARPVAESDRKSIGRDVGHIGHFKVRHSQDRIGNALRQPRALDVTRIRAGRFRRLTKNQHGTR